MNQKPLRACRDCGEDLSLSRTSRRAVYCQSCADERRRETQIRADRKRAEARKAYVRTEAARKRNREAVRQYRQTEKGRQAARRAEAKPARYFYKQAWSQENRPVFLRCPPTWSFDRWIDSVIFDPPAPFPVLHLEGPWRPFICPDYLK